MGLINRIDQICGEAVRSRAEAASVRAPTGTIDVERLERAIGELALAVKTVQRIAVDKGFCTAEELQQKLRAIDLEDGRSDGRAPIS